MEPVMVGAAYGHKIINIRQGITLPAYLVVDVARLGTALLAITGEFTRGMGG